MKQLGNNLAELTAEKLKAWVKDQMNSRREVAVTNQMEITIKQLGETHNLSQDQVSALIAAVRQGHVKNRLNGD